MLASDVLNLRSMPVIGGSYPRGPYRFINREYLIITYETDREILERLVPEPLVPESNLVAYEFMRMPDSSGFGNYSESGVVIPCLLNGEKVNFTLMMFLNDEPPITGGREIWGFPKKWGQPKLEVTKDTLTGTLHYDDHRVAIGTMTYKHENLLLDPAHSPQENVDSVAARLSKKQVNLKLIPCVTGGLAIAQLISYRMTDITVKGAWKGDARLHLVPHVNAPVADLPVRRVVGGTHFIADLTLPYGEVEHDYLK